jgi:hypothetical protein
MSNSLFTIPEPLNCVVISVQLNRTPVLMICAGPLKVTRFSTRVIRGHAMVFRLWAGQFRNFLTADSVADPESF